MKTVPTLCATGTILGVSGVGLGLGREATPRHPSRKRKQNDLQPAAVRTAATTTSPAPPPSTQPVPSRAPTPAHPSRHDGQRRAVRSMTIADPSQPLHAVLGNNYTPAGELSSNELNPTGRPQSRRASWIKRLSAISNSQPSSRDTSPGPLSPSVSCSNGSMAFSHDGSTAPMIGERPPPPLPPNKLVKRSSSVHDPHANPIRNSTSRLPSFRRPATSHQRSATLQHRAALLDMTAENPSSDDHVLQPSTDSEVEYTQYFTARMVKDKSKRKGARSSNATALTRILPDEKHRPTLMLATSVSAGPDAAADVVEDSASEDSESLYLVSRPNTALSLTAVLTTQNDPSPSQPQPRPSDSNLDRPSAGNAGSGARTRRSFSISDLLSPGSNAKKLRPTKLPGVKLARRISQTRASSDPLSNTEKRRSNTAHGDSGTISARQHLTDPALVRRDIATSSGPTPFRTPQYGPPGSTTSAPWPLPEMSPHAAARSDPLPAPMRLSDVQPSLAGTHQPPPPSTVAQAGVRPSRNSIAPSEQASTLVESENDARGAGTGDENDADMQSETVFDSLRTGATRSTSGARGPRIETIFDESPPSKVKVTALRDLLPKGTFREQALDAAPGKQNIAEEEESIPTPVRTVVPDRSIHDSPNFARGASAPLFPKLVPSPPPDMPKPLSLGTLEWDSRVEDDGSSSGWSVDDDDDSWADLPPRLSATLVAAPGALGRPDPQTSSSRHDAKPTTPQHSNLDHGDKDARSSLFDWSEQQPADKSSGNRTPPRPSTVHGKKDADRRGSRAVSRRAPSGLHARSQSVPVVPDAAGKRSTVVTNKFGTWGVGSKGVTEDWNDDFDFADLDEGASVPGTVQSQRIDSGVAMIVPNHIQEQQNNVLANIGLLREWGLLIEELKEQRVRAACLGILDGSHAGVWEEVDAMIDLADQEAEEEGVPRSSPPPSPGFDEVDFDDVPGSGPNGAEIRKSGLASDALGRQSTPSRSPPHLKRKTILPPNHKIFGPQSSPMPAYSRHDPSSTPTNSSQPVNRPRKDSEAKARSVIEALQKRKSIHEPLPDTQPLASTQKVPFDTATLRRIVPYVGALTRKVKEILREAEGLYTSPSTSLSKEAEPPFSRMFPADNELSTQMKLMTVV